MAFRLTTLQLVAASGTNAIVPCNVLHQHDPYVSPARPPCRFCKNLAVLCSSFPSILPCDKAPGSSQPSHLLNPFVTLQLPVNCVWYYIYAPCRNSCTTANFPALDEFPIGHRFLRAPHADKCEPDRLFSAPRIPFNRCLFLLCLVAKTISPTFPSLPWSLRYEM